MSAQENPVVQEFTAEEITRHAQGNANAITLITLAYMKEKGQSAAEWIEFAGRRIAPGWEELKGQGANIAARFMALNMASLGATVHSLSGDERNAEFTVSNWPAQGLVEFIGLTKADTTPLWDIFRPIAEYLNLHYERHEEGELVRLRLSQ